MRTQPHREGIASIEDTSEGSRACGDRGREQIMAEQGPCGCARVHSVIFRHTRNPEEVNWDIVVQQLGSEGKIKATQEYQSTTIRLNDPHILETRV
jgi:hypothetical protein